MMNTHWFGCILWLLICPGLFAYHLGGAGLFKAASATRITIEVGLGLRAPFLIDEINSPGFYGAGPEILDVMNQVQSKYYFVCHEIPSKRKVKAVKGGKLDIMMWDNPSWGWQNEHVVKSSALVASKDVYIALKKPGRNQQYFAAFTGKKIALVMGYHYKMTNFVIDIATIDKKFDVTMVRTEEAGIRMVSAERVDMAVTSETALHWYFKRYPQYQDEILISDKFDTQYSRYFVVPRAAPIKADELNRILQTADEQQLLTPIYQRYGLTKPQRFVH